MHMDRKSENLRISRLGRCEVCDTKEACYSCPKCEVKTCSLRCVQIHKNELNCNGIRDRTKYMPIRDMTPREFMSDYYFLEDCTRYTEARKRDPIKKYTHEMRKLPLPLHRMRAACYDRGIQLQLLLPNFTRNKENTSYYDWKLKRLYWHVEWVFINAMDQETGKPVKLVDKRCDEHQTLRALLYKYMDTDALQQHSELEYYHSAGLGKISALLPAKNYRRIGCHYYKLDLDSTLRENLNGTNIIEFPTIYLTYEQPSPGCDINDITREAVEEGTNQMSQTKMTTTENALSASSNAPPCKRRCKSPVNGDQATNIYELAAILEAYDTDDKTSDTADEEEISVADKEDYDAVLNNLSYF